MGKIEKCVEIICEKGCQYVRKDIDLLEAGKSFDEVEGLTDDEKQMVLKELKSIMSVYGDSCRVDFS